ERARLGGRPVRPRLVFVLQGVREQRAQDAVDFGGIGDAGLLQAVGAGLLQRVHLETVRRGDRVLPAREAADHAAATVQDVERDTPVFVLEPIVDHGAGGGVLSDGVWLDRAKKASARPYHELCRTRYTERPRV